MAVLLGRSPLAVLLGRAALTVLFGRAPLAVLLGGAPLAVLIGRAALAVLIGRAALAVLIGGIPSSRGWMTGLGLLWLRRRCLIARAGAALAPVLILSRGLGFAARWRCRHAAGARARRGCQGGHGIGGAGAVERLAGLLFAGHAVELVGLPAVDLVLARRGWRHAADIAPSDIALGVGVDIGAGVAVAGAAHDIAGMLGAGSVEGALLLLPSSGIIVSRLHARCGRRPLPDRLAVAILVDILAPALGPCVGVCGWRGVAIGIAVGGDVAVLGHQLAPQVGSVGALGDRIGAGALDRLVAGVAVDDIAAAIASAAVLLFFLGAHGALAQLQWDARLAVGALLPFGIVGGVTVGAANNHQSLQPEQRVLKNSSVLVSQEKLNKPIFQNHQMRMSSQGSV